MSTSNEIDYGPIAGLIGTWKGEKGLDIAPGPKEEEISPYYETLTFQAAGDVENAEEQVLTVLRYHHSVYRQSNNKQFHDQVGYITWDANSQIVTNTFVIPRGVAVVAGGKVISSDDEAGEIVISVKAAEDDQDWTLSQAPFMRDKAKTQSYSQTLTLKGDTLSYEQTMMLDIYGRPFEHVDRAALHRV